MLYNSSSPFGIIIIGIMMMFTGIVMLVSGIISMSLSSVIIGGVLLFFGLFFFVTILLLKKYYIPKHGIDNLFPPCKYGHEATKQNSENHDK